MKTKKNQNCCNHLFNRFNLFINLAINWRKSKSDVDSYKRHNAWAQSAHGGMELQLKVFSALFPVQLVPPSRHPHCVHGWIVRLGAEHNMHDRIVKWNWGQWSYRRKKLSLFMMSLLFIPMQMGTRIKVSMKPAECHWRNGYILQVGRIVVYMHWLVHQENWPLDNRNWRWWIS